MFTLGRENYIGRDFDIKRNVRIESNGNIVPKEVLLAVNMPSTLSWDVTPCNMVEHYQCFGGTS
jgi:hypothetical protein